MNNISSSAWHKKRMRAEARFKLSGRIALAIAVLMLFLLLSSLVLRGMTGFVQSQALVNVVFDKDILAMEKDEKLPDLSASRFTPLLRAALKKQFSDVTEQKDLRDLYALFGNNTGFELKNIIEANNSLLGQETQIWLPLSSNADLFIKNNSAQTDGKINEMQSAWIKNFSDSGKLRKIFNTGFFTQGDSRNPESAGFLGAMVGSAFTLVICLLVVFPLGVATAVFLEEFAKKGRWVDFIEVNINNLAAVPSIVFGLLGLAVYINTMGMPRSSSMVGGMTLALMILPVIIITTRTSLKSIPDSIRDAARALGATPVQMVWHHTLPLSMPGIMTGTILGMARAIGETAPLLMIGMVAFVADIPGGFTSPATVMPVQVYLWASSPEAGFAEKTAAGILVLLMLLIAMNMLAIILRKKFEVRW